MALRLNGSSSGYVELEVPADAGSHTLTLPDGGGSSGQYLQTNGSGTLSWQDETTTNLTRGTNVAVSGTTNFTGFENIAIRKLTVLFDEVTRSASSGVVIRLGTTGGLVTSNYESGVGFINTSNSANAATANASFFINVSGSAALSGSATFFNPTGNIWVLSGVIKTGNSVHMSSGRLDVGGTLSQISVFSSAGSLNGGNINIMYEV